MPMDPRSHPRGAPPDFTLPQPNPNTSRVTNALWWLVCMRLRLEPTLSRNGGTFANKPGSHNAGENLPDFGAHDRRTDHSIRDPINRTGPWWRQFTAAHDWTFVDAQRGDYRTINRYTKRRLAAMRDPDDPRPGLCYHYILGQADGDPVVEGYHVLRDEVLSSSDLTHLWHLHDSFLRSAVGDFWAMWAALTIDMGWTVAEWRQSLPGDAPAEPAREEIEMFMVKAQDGPARYVSDGLTRRHLPNMTVVEALTRAGVKSLEVATTAELEAVAGPVAGDVVVPELDYDRLARSILRVAAEQG